MTSAGPPIGLLPLLVEVWASLPAELVEDVLPPQPVEVPSGYGEAPTPRRPVA